MRTWSSSASPTARSPRSRAEIPVGPWVAHTSGARTPRRARPARPPLQPPPAPDLRPGGGPGAARRRLGRRQRRERRGARAAGFDARRPARPRGLRDRRTRRAALPRRAPPSRELPRDAPLGRRRALRSRRRAAGGPPPAHAPDDGQRLRAHRAARARRLGDRRAAIWRSSASGGPSWSRCIARSPRRRRGGRRAVTTARTIAELRAALDPFARAVAGSGSSPRWARCIAATRRSSAGHARECDVVVASIFVNPAQFGRPRTSSAIRATSSAMPTPRRSALGRRPSSSSRRSRRCTRRVPDLGRGRGALDAVSRATRGPATSAASPRSA